MDFQFNEKVEQQFKKSGWKKERKVNIDKWLEKLKGQGFTPTPFAEAILSNFGGLTIDPVSDDDCQYCAEPVTFNPLLEDSASPEAIHSWEKDFNLELFPLGLTSDGLRVLIGKDEKIYGATSDMFFKCGQNLNEGLQNLILANTLAVKMS